MKLNFLNILFSFSFFSLIGWALEVFYRSIANKKFVNPGLLKGPYLILYGTGALALIIAVSCFKENNIFIKIFVYFIVTTGLELIAALFAEKIFNAQLWDYSKERFQFRGHICLKFSFYWVLLAFGFEYLLFPLFRVMDNYMLYEIKLVFTIILISLILIDFVFVVLNKFLSGRKKTAERGF